MSHMDCTRLGTGDLACDGPETFSCLRGATAESAETTPGGVRKILLIKAEQPHEKVITYVMPRLPSFLLVTTAEDKRFEVTLLSVIGWLLVGGGFLVLLTSGGKLWIAALGSAVTGIGVVAGAQLARAVLDTADETRMVRKLLEIQVRG